MNNSEYKYTFSRDINAAVNLKQLVANTTLPVARSSSNGDTVGETVSTTVGKVTPVKYEYGNGSGQEINSVRDLPDHYCTHL